MGRWSKNLEKLEKKTLPAIWHSFVDFLWLNKSDLQYQGEFWTALGKSFPMMVLDVKIDKVITEKIAGKVFFFKFL